MSPLALIWVVVTIGILLLLVIYVARRQEGIERRLSDVETTLKSDSGDTHHNENDVWSGIP